MKKNKRNIRTPVFLLLIGVIVLIGTTYSYLTYESEEVVNRITFSDIEEELGAILTEPDWDGIVDYEYDDSGKLTPIEAIDPEKEYGEDIADRFLPGMEIPKNPFITNTSQSCDEWVAMKVWFVYGEGHPREGEPMNQADYIKVCDIVHPDYNLTDWELISGGQTDNDGTVIENSDLTPYKEFYYKKKLKKGFAGNYGEQTEPLFTKIIIDPAANNEQFEALYDLYGFVIYAEGAVAQARSADTYESFREWGISGGITYTNSPAPGAPVSVTRPGITGKSENH